MRLELITIGNELLLGFTIDTNAAYLARELAALGVSVVRRATVADDASEIASAVRDALGRTGAVITTGGLGPTSDDLTRSAIAELFGRELVPDESRWDALRALWRERGRGEIPLTNRAQIMIPAGALVLDNRHGTAPGVFIEDDRGRWCAMLPGVPREMRGMFGDALLPVLSRRLGGERRVVRSRTLRTTSIAESHLAERLGPLAVGVDGLPLAYLPGQDGVDLRVTVRDVSPDAADAALGHAIGVLRERVGPYAYGEERDDLAAVVLALCKERGLRIAVGESCTGGLLGARLTAIPGSSAVVEGGVIAYSNAVKTELLSVPAELIAEHGAVSEPVARAMADGARAHTGADIGIGITGVAGPDGGTPEKLVGLVWIAVTSGHAAKARGPRLVGDRSEIRYRATQVALDMVRRMVAG